MVLKFSFKKLVTLIRAKQRRPVKIQCGIEIKTKGHLLRKPSVANPQKNKTGYARMSAKIKPREDRYLTFFSSCSCSCAQEVPIVKCGVGELNVSIMDAQINHQRKSNNIRSLFITFVK